MLHEITISRGLEMLQNVDMIIKYFLKEDDLGFHLRESSEKPFERKNQMIWKNCLKEYLCSWLGSDGLGSWLGSMKYDSKVV